MSGSGLCCDSPSGNFTRIISPGRDFERFSPMWWLGLERGRRFLGVAIVEGDTLAAARLRATTSGVAVGAKFTVGHLLDARCRAMLAPDQIGRMLSAAEAADLAKRFERDAPKKAPAARSRRKPRGVVEAGK